MAKKNIQPSNLNRDGFSQNFLAELEKDDYIYFKLNEIYKEFVRSYENPNNAVLTMKEISEILRSYSVKNNNKNFKMIYHHQGTSWFANEVFFAEKTNQRKDAKITTSYQAIDEIVKQLRVFNADKAGTQAKLQNVQNKIKTRFEKKIQLLFQRNLTKTNKSQQRKFSHELHKLVTESRYDFERIEILKILANNKYLIQDIDDADYIEDYLKNMNKEIDANLFASHFSFSKDFHKKLVKAFNQNQHLVKKLGAGLAESYQNVFNEIIREGYNYRQIESSIRQNTYWKIRKGVRETTLSYNNRITTLSRTFSHGIDNLINFNQEQEAGITKFKYVGNPHPQRPFCQQHFGKTYTVAEINKTNNGQGLDVMTFAGGYNCRHFWIPEI